MFETSGLSVHFLKKEAFSGSYCGMRYTIMKSEEGIVVYAYPEPWCLEATAKEDITENTFPFSPEGVESAVNWLEDIYTEKQPYWNKADKEKMAKILQRK